MDRATCVLTSVALTGRRSSRRSSAAAAPAPWNSVPLGGGEGPRGYPCGGEMGPPSPPQAPIFLAFFFARFFTCFHGNSAYLRPCYHALRHPFGAADRAMLLN